MTDLSQVTRLLSRLHTMVEELRSNPDLEVHRQVSDFFYMQKSAELKMLVNEMNALTEKQKRLQHLLDTLYPQTLIQWQRDLRWLNLHQQKSDRDSIHDLSM